MLYMSEQLHCLSEFSRRSVVSCEGEGEWPIVLKSPWEAGKMKLCTSTHIAYLLSDLP